MLSLDPPAAARQAGEHADVQLERQKNRVVIFWNEDHGKSRHTSQASSFRIWKWRSRSPVSSTHFQRNCRFLGPEAKYQ